MASPHTNPDNNQTPDQRAPILSTAGAIQSILLGFGILIILGGLLYVGIIPVFGFAAGAIFGPCLIIFGLSHLLIPKHLHGTKLQEQVTTICVCLVLVAIIGFVGWYLLTAVFPSGL